MFREAGFSGAGSDFALVARANRIFGDFRGNSAHRLKQFTLLFQSCDHHLLCHSHNFKGTGHRIDAFGNGRRSSPAASFQGAKRDADQRSNEIRCTVETSNGAGLYAFPSR